MQLAGAKGLPCSPITADPGVYCPRKRVVNSYIADQTMHRFTFHNNCNAHAYTDGAVSRGNAWEINPGSMWAGPSRSKLTRFFLGHLSIPSQLSGLLDCSFTCGKAVDKR